MGKCVQLGVNCQHYHKNYIIPPIAPPTANNFAHIQSPIAHRPSPIAKPKEHMNNSYKKLDVYAKSRQLVVTVYSLLKHFPAEEKYALGDQMRRAVISVPSNIAEGLSQRLKSKRTFGILRMVH